uniref:WD40 repeat-containing protein SMU1 n=1 Tax=Mucochytrium quahogii TaxID=96639 RepID=A0A7S2RPI1_9STRA|mmetsp:Transcript_21042/g.34346  ORF Transcript_21042/g.34346 Transcript_21042/m.34346 type:complete len:512 (-) Transcript_21042:493-2028(-)|eukprot:CAMPEP_0203761410 /NCGR_PEP_ID=MMETSP0098-20131031/14504_1 /ASSEMBLY_ACC=CAM_ASM_000208 /TAXON_ID=96639 /ORGANISM=" , Strain NY0313808BC1" /LENGTH=511 /DNA_ID=CAMNT_0050655395 /DNA_START=492 /DNA_END=2027 /DNA_ORIENTATION=+
MEVDAEDVVKVVLQFLRESGLETSAHALEKESGVRLNFVQDKTHLVDLIRQGAWTKVLTYLQGCELQCQVIWELYEIILDDLVDKGEFNVAKQILKESEDLNRLKLENGELYDNLQELVYRPEHRKKKKLDKEVLVRSILSGVQDCPRSRLLELLGYSLRWQRKQNGSPCLVPRTNKTKRKRDRDELSDESHSDIVEISKIRLGSESPAHAIAFSSNNRMFATGSVDGFLEIWDWKTGKLRKDLAYQANDNILKHRNGILSIDFSQQEDALVSCSSDGVIKIWDILSGTCKIKLKRAHEGKPVGCVKFTPQGDNIVSGGDDSMVRVHSCKTGRMLCHMAGHKGSVSSICFSQFQGNPVIASSSADHTVKIWSMSNPVCLYTLDFNSPVNTIFSLTKSKLGVVASSSSMEIVDFRNKAEERIEIPCPNSKGRFLLGSGSTNGTILVSTEDGNVHCCYVPPSGSCKPVFIDKFHAGDILQVTSHAGKNIGAVSTANGTVRIFKYDKKKNRRDS